MALTKRQYTDGQTIITAANLNEIQDCIIDIEGSYVPKTRTVAGKALSSNITLSASDVGAVPTSRTVNSKALSSNITLAAADVGAVPVSRTVNSKALSSNITLNASDVGAVPTSRTVNSKALSSNITLAAGDIGYSSSTTYSASTVGKAISDLSSAINDFGSVPLAIGKGGTGATTESDARTNLQVTSGRGRVRTLTGNQTATLTFSGMAGGMLLVTGAYAGKMNAYLFGVASNGDILLQPIVQAATPTVTITGSNYTITIANGQYNAYVNALIWYSQTGFPNFVV